MIQSACGSSSIAGPELLEDVKSDKVGESQSSEIDNDETVRASRPRRRRHIRNVKHKGEVNYAVFADPSSLTEALSSPEEKEWRKAMDEEYRKLIGTSYVGRKKYRYLRKLRLLEASGSSIGS
uniref:Uncharacterized protein n=1 Tax=Trichuris muris TaxID=70415 RepID=A0A5S6Q7R8_TRIMR